MRPKKIRRESGRVHVTGDIDQGIPDVTYWDDWVDWRDGMRFLGGIDKTKLHNKVCACYVCRVLPEHAPDRDKVLRKEAIRQARKRGRIGRN